jgi:hypothetical protein
VSWRTVENATGARPNQAIPVDSVVVDERVWDSVKKGEAETFKRLANLVSAAAEDADEKRLGWRLIVRMDPKRRIPKFEIEDAGRRRPEPTIWMLPSQRPGRGDQPCGQNLIRTRNALGGGFWEVYRSFERSSAHKVSTK